MHEKRTLAIDVGGTKFSIAVFDGNRMVRRESRRTDAEGGRDWMLDQISTIARGWQQEMPADRCGIGFGGPVIFTEQRVALSTHVGGWRDFRLTDWVRGKCHAHFPRTSAVGATSGSPTGCATCSACRPSWITTPTPARWARPASAPGVPTRRCST